MSTLRMWLAQLVGLFDKRRRDRELAEEFASHLEMQTDELIRRGVAPDEAWRLAVVRSGGIEAAKEAYREQHSMRGLERARQTVTHAAHQLRRSPGHSAAVVLSIALGLGLTTAIYGVVDAVLRRPLPFEDAEGLLSIGVNAVRDEPSGGRDFVASSPDWEHGANNLRPWLDASMTVGASATYSAAYNSVVGLAAAEHVEGAYASSTLLPLLGVAPGLGRWFAPGEGREPLVVLSHALWRRQFGDDSGAIGRTLRIDGAPHTVIGVMAPRAAFPTGAQFWLQTENPNYARLLVRARPGVTIEQLRQEFERRGQGIANLRRAGYATDVVALPLREYLYGPVRPALKLLFGAAVLLLVIACANVAGLSLARTLERRREFAVRTALGATRRTLAALVVAENLLLAGAGTVIAVMLAYWSTRVVLALGPDDVARAADTGVHVNGVLFAGAVALAAAFLVSIAPALTAAQRDVQSGLVQGSIQQMRGRVSQRVRGGFVAAQVAVALMLVTGAGLLVRSVARLTSVELGFDPQGVVIVSPNLFGVPEYRQAGASQRFVEPFVARVRALPGVEHVGVGPAPLVAGTGASGGYREGFNMLFGDRDTTQEGSPSFSVWVKHIDPEYLDALGIRVQSGRAFLTSDNASAARVAILNATAARTYFGDASPIGRSIAPVALTRDGRPPLEIVGVIDDMLQRDLALEPMAEILLPAAQQGPSFEPTVIVRTSGSAQALARSLRGIITELEPALATTRLEPMADVVKASLAPHTFLLVLLGVFAGLAVVLSILGVYAVVAYLVAQRRHEFGVRLALGAQRRHVLGLVLGEGATLVAIGIAIGAPAAFVLSRFLSGLLYEVSVHDTVAFVAAPVVLAATALVASSIPARAASRLDPAATLRAE